MALAYRSKDMGISMPFLDVLNSVALPVKVEVSGLTAYTSVPTGLSREKFFDKMRGRAADISGLVDDLLETRAQLDIWVEAPYLDDINLDHSSGAKARAIQLFWVDSRGVPCGYVQVSIAGDEREDSNDDDTYIKVLASSLTFDSVYLSKDLRGLGYGSTISKAAVSLAMDVWGTALQLYNVAPLPVVLRFKAETESISGWLVAKSAARACVGDDHKGNFNDNPDSWLDSGFDAVTDSDIPTGSMVRRGHPVEFYLEIG